MATGPLEWEHIMRHSAPAPLPSSRTPPARPAPAAAAAAAATTAAAAAQQSAAAAAVAAARLYSSAPQAYYKQEIFRAKGFTSVKVTKGAVPLHMGSKRDPTTVPDEPPPPYDLVMALDRSGSPPPPPPASSVGSASSYSSSRTSSSWNNGGVLRPRDYKPSPANGGKKKQVSFRLAPARSSDGGKPKGTPAQRSSRRKPPLSSSSPPSRKPVRHANGATQSSERGPVVDGGSGSGNWPRREEASPTKPRSSSPKESSPPSTHSSSAKGHARITVVGDGNGSRNVSRREETSPTKPRSSSPKKSSPPKAASSPPDEDGSLVVSVDVAEIVLGKFGRAQETPARQAKGSQPSLVEDRDRSSAPPPAPSRRKNVHYRGTEINAQAQRPLATPPHVLGRRHTIPSTYQ